MAFIGRNASVFIDKNDRKPFFYAYAINNAGKVELLTNGVVKDDFVSIRSNECSINKRVFKVSMEDDAIVLQDANPLKTSVATLVKIHVCSFKQLGFSANG